MTFQSNGPIANENYSIATGANSSGPFIAVFMNRDPNSFDAQYPVKQRWINTTDSREWVLTGYSNVTGRTLATWMQLLGGDAVNQFGVPNGTSPILPDANGLINFTSSSGSIAITGSAGGLGAQNINFDVQNYTNSTWVPTVDGSTPGSTVYGVQFGSYVEMDAIVQAQFTVTISSATGTGDLQIGGLPVPINAAVNGNVIGSVIMVTSLTWPVGTTSIALLGSPGNSFLTIWCSGSGTAGSRMQMANTPMNIQGTIIYEN